MEGDHVSRQAKWEYLQAIYDRYQGIARSGKQTILDELCRVTGWNRKYAIRRLNGPPPGGSAPRHRRRPTYSPEAIRALAGIWEAAGYPWSVRLQALLPLWLPWARQRFRLTAELERQLRRISCRQIDRRLGPHRKKAHRRLYGRTKPGALLKHHIPLQIGRWRTTQPGFSEVDLVSHSGNSAAGEFLHSLNLTDIHTTWVETRAVMGKAQHRVCKRLEEMRTNLPFRLCGIDSDNGSEFLNHQLWRYCQRHHIRFTRGRPYKKDDNAHIEQKNWTHVRKLLGYVRYDTPEALAAINDLYRNELRLLQNLFLPSVKLLGKKRVGSRLRRRYGPPQTPLQRVVECPSADPEKVRALVALRDRLDPFALAETVDRKLERIYALANHRRSPRPVTERRAKKKTERGSQRLTAMRTQTKTRVTFQMAR